MEKTPTSALSIQRDYQLFFENAPDAVVLIDQYNRIQFWNPKAEAIFGWSSVEVVGRILSGVIVPPAFRSAHDNGMKRHLATGEVRVLNKTIEVPALHRTGREFFISLTISRIELQGITGFLAFIRDITEQKHNQAQLEQKTRELERSNQQLQDFASIASHDLKEPLRKISMFANMITTSEETLSEKARTNLQKIGDAAFRMQQLIDAVLSYSSVDTAVQKQRCSLEELLQETLVSLETRIQDSGARVASDGLQEAEVIPFQIQQVFQNLISNALKFSKRDVPPQIKITHQIVSSQEANLPTGPGGTYLQIKVSDNGIGFNQEASEKIFGLFQRLHGKSAFEGSGLGLAICRKVAENHEGSISATSEPNVGSTFTLLLPL